MAGINTFIHDKICVPYSLTNCPQLPTASQGVLELAGLKDTTLGAGRSEFNIPVAPYVDAADARQARPFRWNLCATPPCVDPLNPVALAIDPSVLLTVNPLPFIAAKNSEGTATPTQLSDPDANIFFYAVGGASTTSIVDPKEPDTLLLFYEDLNRGQQEPQAGPGGGQHLAAADGSGIDDIE